MRVAVISPYRGDIHLNKRYCLYCCRDCVSRLESPFAGHLFYTQFLNDGLATDRIYGMEAYRDWIKVAEIVAVYTDLETSEGMQGDIAFAQRFNIPITYRVLDQEIMYRKVLCL